MKIDDKTEEVLKQYFIDQLKLKTMSHYADMVQSYDFNNLDKDLEYIFGSIEQVTDILEYNCDHIPADIKETHKIIDAQYWNFKYLSNLVNFINIMKPITRHINPTDEDKAKFVEFIKKMEEEKDGE